MIGFNGSPEISGASTYPLTSRTLLKKMRFDYYIGTIFSSFSFFEELNFILCASCRTDFLKDSSGFISSKKSPETMVNDG